MWADIFIGTVIAHYYAECQNRCWMFLCAIHSTVLHVWWFNMNSEAHKTGNIQFIKRYSWLDVLDFTCSLERSRLFLRMATKNGRFCQLLRVQSAAAVNAGLTGSVDRTSPWQHCVDPDRSQKTFGSLVEHDSFVFWPLSDPKRKKNGRMQSACLRMTMGLKRERWRRLVRPSFMRVFMCWGMIQRYKEEKAFRYRFSFHSYSIFCCAGISNFIYFFFFTSHSIALRTI